MVVRCAALSLGDREMCKENSCCGEDYIRLTFFGDSICVGQGVSIYRGWVTRIAKYFDEYAKTFSRKILVTNSSINGRTTRQALEDMPYSIQSPGVDILVIQFGLNDCNYWDSDKGVPRVSLGAYKENLREIIERGLNFGAYKVILNNNHPTVRDTDIFPNTLITYEDSNKLFNTVVRELAEDFTEGFIFLDIEKYFKEFISNGNSMSDYLLPDGLHLSELGHTAYYDKILPVLKSVIDNYVESSK
jgi:acyl-CoA thioesterase I